ncbi:MAG TPA: UbiX family flavin prenyltransferase [Proteobacteria bacterium]|nr:UbiX family flavin prenyltransferase [Pseudomonadota bacterium]
MAAGEIEKKIIVVGVSGASGALYAERLLLALRAADGVESHLIVSPVAARIIEHECRLGLAEFQALADYSHAADDFFAAPASGSFAATGMVIAPCSMKRLAGIANSFADDLMGRAADVMLKERRRLLLLVRETPLHSGHLELMLKVSRLGGVIMPPVPALYQRPAGIVEMADQTIGRVMSLFGIENELYQAWGQGKSGDMT